MHTKGAGGGTQRALEYSKGASRILGNSGHLGTWVFKTLSQLGTRTLQALGHSKGIWATGHSRYLSTLTLRHFSTRALEEHLGTQTPGHLGT